MNSVSNAEPAKNIGYDNSDSGLSAADVQGAIDELAQSYPADKVMMSGGVTSVEDAITNLVKTETKQVTVTSDANHVVMLGVSKPNVVVNVEILGVIVLGYTTYANEWLCSLADYSGTQITSGTYTATIYYI